MQSDNVKITNSTHALADMNYTGVIIEESLTDMSALNGVKILSTEVEPVTEGHKTPWVKQWTMHTVEVGPEKVAEVAERISGALDPEHAWYADFKNDMRHYILFYEKVFCVDRASKAQYDKAAAYGISLGIPAYQVDFSPDIVAWNR